MLSPAGESERPRPPLDELGQLQALFVGALQCLLVECDLGLEPGPAAAVPPGDALKLALRGCELLGGARGLSVELLLLLGEEAAGRVAPRRVLVVCERFGDGAGEGAGGAFGR
ncbi:MAG: hypothetical protein ACRDLK_04905, partial [Gaiellaceae bacterium]